LKSSGSGREIPDRSRRVLREWTNHEFVQRLGLKRVRVPAIYGGDMRSAFFLMEDLGGAVPLDTVLCGGDRELAEASLAALVAGLAELHAASAGAELAYRAALDRRGLRARHWAAEELREPLARVGRLLGVTVAGGLERDLLRLRELFEGCEYRTFNHGDLCLCNALVADGLVALIDWEWARFGDPMGDATALWEGFPLGWHSAVLPDDVAKRLVVGYFAELRERDARAPAEKRFMDARLAAAAHYAVRGWIESGPEKDVPLGLSSSRQRVLRRTHGLLEQGGARLFPDLCQLLEGMATSLEREPSISAPGLRPFPAFDTASPGNEATPLAPHLRPLLRSDYAGTYRVSRFVTFTVSARGGAMYLEPNWDGRSRLRLRPIGDDLFELAEHDLRLDFRRSNGHVKGVETTREGHSTYAQKIEGKPWQSF
jgi:aminoglycoside phosphotransferase (APT) family kinase protein